jgi:hypothetical protein
MKVAETNEKCSPNLSRPTQILRTITTYIAFVNPNSDVVSIRLDELSECQITSIVLALFPAFLADMRRILFKQTTPKEFWHWGNDKN